MTLHKPLDEHRDIALTAILGLIDKDIAAGRNVRDLPAELAAAMHNAMEQIQVNLDEKLEGDVAL